MCSAPFCAWLASGDHVLAVGAEEAVDLRERRAELFTFPRDVAIAQWPFEHIDDVVRDFAAVAGAKPHAQLLASSGIVFTIKKAHSLAAGLAESSFAVRSVDEKPYRVSGAQAEGCSPVATAFADGDGECVIILADTMERLRFTERFELTNCALRLSKRWRAKYR